MVETRNALVGQYVNMAYPLPSGVSVPFLNDQTTYLGTQLESEAGDGRCFGIAAYGAESADPELVLYKKR